MKQRNLCFGGCTKAALLYGTRDRTMRKFLSSTAGASFNQEVATQTICVRKDCVELIYKVKPSVYGVARCL